MKNLFKIHPFFYIVMFISFITGNIYDYLVFTGIIIVHELGHIFSGVMFSWKINRVIILPFGGLTIFNKFINTSLLEEFFVAISGPLFQIVFFFIISHCFSLSSSVIYFNFVLFVFNLLPIYPLDGSKILYVVLCLLFPIKLSFFLVSIISFLFIMFVFVFIGHFDFVVFLILFFLLYRCFYMLFNYHNFFYKFLFERYLYNFDFKCLKKVRNVGNMYLWCRHLFFYNDNFVSEKKFLSKLFDK